ncbi:MAG: DNA repair protein RadC [Lachnospiraceae bacterium]|nr:DNA repair protein RadC [Lachnospiraceae bacterium]MDE6185674.1 DNA repair protein RadC [Lachnospiraceae bacterium]MDE7287327.1 DNA repair protein RadC [Lachnospiraceae bacterium]
MQTAKQNTELPYEKFLKHGSASLTEAELLAIILRTGTRNCSALEMAKKVLTLAGGQDLKLNSLHHLSLNELMEIPGIGEVKAVKIKCLSELAVRMALEKASASLKYDSPETVAGYYMEKMRHKEMEIILLLLLDNKLRLIEEYTLSQGTVRASLLSSREIFIKALKCRACHLMLLHNHPSGDPSPSQQDIVITQKIKEAGELMDIPLIDHIVVGDGCYISLKEKDLL